MATPRESYLAALVLLSFFLSLVSQDNHNTPNQTKELTSLATPLMQGSPMHTESSGQELELRQPGESRARPPWLQSLPVCQILSQPAVRTDDLPKVSA